MKINRVVSIVLMASFALMSLSGGLLAQGPVTTMEKAKPIQAARKITVIGKIKQHEGGGTYYIRGEKPREVLRILNQNPAALAPYAQSGQSVTIEARIIQGDNLDIDSINGKPYQAPQKK